MWYAYVINCLFLSHHLFFVVGDRHVVLRQALFPVSVGEHGQTHGRASGLCDKGVYSVSGAMWGWAAVTLSHLSVKSVLIFMISRGWKLVPWLLFHLYSHLLWPFTFNVLSTAPFWTFSPFCYTSMFLPLDGTIEPFSLFTPCWQEH